MLFSENKKNFAPKLENLAEGWKLVGDDWASAYIKCGGGRGEMID